MYPTSGRDEIVLKFWKHKSSESGDDITYLHTCTPHLQYLVHECHNDKHLGERTLNNRVNLTYRYCIYNMSAFFRSFISRFKSSQQVESLDLPRRSFQPGPFTTGANIEAQTSPRQRRFWARDSSKWSERNTLDAGKDGKPPRTEKMGTINGVFIPTTLNVLSILMYLRVSP
jgi:hypothetical protein